MNSYNNAYNKSRRDAKARDLEVYESQRVDLVNAIKREYNISDFSVLTESEKKAVRNLVTEMWSPKTGLNKAGEEFIKNGERPLNESSSEDRVMNAFKKKVIGMLRDKFAAGSIFNSSDKEAVSKFMEEINAKVNPVDKKTGKKTGSNIPVASFKEWFYDAAGSYVCSEARKHVF